MIRPATINDIPRLIHMGKKFHEEALVDKGLGYVPTDLIRYYVTMMESPIAVFLVAEDEGIVVGSIGGMIVPWNMDFSQLILLEQWWWVDPEYRGAKVALDLEEGFARWGKDNGANKIIMVSINLQREETVKRYYRRKGYKYLETHFIKGI